MDYSKFYTPQEVASLLIKMLSIPQPKRIIDICCGSCNLLSAAGRRWKDATLTGVDTASQIADGVQFVRMDGREFAIQTSQRYPLVLANPPFDYVGIKREYPELFDGVFETYHTSRLENEMLLANLRLLDKTGVLLIIMPSSFVEAESNREIRKIVGRNYYVKNIIKLPEDTFGASHINCYVLEIRRRLGQRICTKSCKAFRDANKYFLSEKVTIHQRDIFEGNWHTDFWSKPNNIELNIRRGNISSQSFSDSGLPVLHTAKQSRNWKPSIRHIKNAVKMPVYADYGDIIVSRIGKSAGQWCRYFGKRVPISDCLFRIKDPDGSIADALAGKKYDHEIKGIAVKYITVNDFKSWYNSVIVNNDTIA